MQSMLKMPDDAIPQYEAELLEQWIEINVQRENFSIIDIITHLPAQAARRR